MLEVGTSTFVDATRRPTKRHSQSTLNLLASKCRFSQSEESLFVRMGYGAFRLSQQQLLLRLRFGMAGRGHFLTEMKHVG